MRVSATGVLDAVGPKNIIRAMNEPISVTQDEVEDYAEQLEADTGHVPADEKEACLDRAFAYCAIDVYKRQNRS